MIKNLHEKEIKSFEMLNEYAKSGEVVFFGCDLFKDAPIDELREAFSLDYKIYNRSIKGLTLSEAEELVGEGVMSLCPKKVFLNLGECDIEKGEETVESLMASYERIIKNIKSADKRCEIFLISLFENEGISKEFNDSLRLLGKKTKCEFIDINYEREKEASYLKIFSRLKCYMHKNITFSKAMLMGAV